MRAAFHSVGHRVSDVGKKTFNAFMPRHRLAMEMGDFQCIKTEGKKLKIKYPMSAVGGHQRFPLSVFNFLLCSASFAKGS
jgi:hypothetical protein